jgi:hypothetical protein
MSRWIVLLVIPGIASIAQARKHNPAAPADQQSLHSAYQRAERKLEWWTRPMYLQNQNKGTRGRVNSTHDESERAAAASFPPPWIDRLDGPFSF